ncbi:ArnT family glycosyltransferase [Bacteroidota bacterium]
MSRIYGFLTSKDYFEYKIFFGIWLIFNLIQAKFTTLHFDEGYYWIYSQKLDWGYFDHPPLVALLIKIGYFFFQNELGLRLFHVLLASITVALILYLIREERDRLFAIIFILSFSIIYAHVGGFLALPDTPMIFFTALFLVLYKKFIESNYSLKFALLLSLVIPLMMYSKYHGILVILFIVASNLQLMRKRNFWLIVLISGILLLPHLFWQVNHEFPTLKYQLIARNTSFNVKRIFEFLLEQVLVAGPFTSIIAFYLAFKYKPQDTFERGLKFTFVGVYMFFFVSCIKGRVEPHWTAIAIIPFIYLAYKKLADYSRLQGIYKTLSIVTIIVMMGLRIALMSDEIVKNNDTPFRYTPAYFSIMEKYAGDREILFVSNYKAASMYSFYQGRVHPSLAYPGYRISFFDFVNFEEAFNGKDIAFFGPNHFYEKKVDFGKKAKFSVRFMDEFYSYRNISIRIATENEFIVKPGDKLQLQFMLKNESDEDLVLGDNEKIKPGLGIRIRTDNAIVDLIRSLEELGVNETWKAKEEKQVKIEIQIPVTKNRLDMDAFIEYAGFRGQVDQSLVVNLKE